MAAAVLCLCEAGNVMSPSSLKEIEEVEATIQRTWEDAATEHVDPNIRFFYTEGEPYIIAFDANLCDCTHPRILRNLYVAGKEPSTAQAFVCCLPGQCVQLGMDISIVHAPSGNIKLTDSQREK